MTKLKFQNEKNRQNFKESNYLHLQKKNSYKAVFFLFVWSHFDFDVISL